MRGVLTLIEMRGGDKLRQSFESVALALDLALQWHQFTMVLLLVVRFCWCGLSVIIVEGVHCHHLQLELS